MTELLFSFDTEDFTSEIAADAIYREAELLRAEGIRGGFCLVGYLAQQLKRWGRDDIIGALKHHDILTHTLRHSVHPTLNEYTDTADFDTAYQELMKQETKAIEMIRVAMGETVICGACPPGNQKTYVGMYGYADMGLPIYADTFCDTDDGEGVFFCNIYQMQYTCSMEGKLFDATEGDLRSLLDRLATYKRVILYTHPNMALYSEFWDKVNYDRSNKCAFGAWKEAKRRPMEATERFYRNMRTLIRMIKQDERFGITSYSEIAARLAAEPKRVIKREDLAVIEAQLKAELAPISTPVSCSLSDVFLACREMLCGANSHTCEKVYGFLEEPYAIDSAITLPKSEVIASAKTFEASHFLPSKIFVGDRAVGPADWMLAALAVLNGCESVTLEPIGQLPSLERLPQLKSLTFRGQWLQSPDFEDRYLSDRLRYQSWTMRFCRV